MSNDVTPVAYRTRLGNATAKSVLALLADQANDDGYGWPKVETIAAKTEIRERTVLRMIQVFVAIGLIAKVDRGRGKNFGIQLAAEKLGCDLSADFARAYAMAQRKADDNCRSDTGGDVAETLLSVAETVLSVAETLPPYPLLGGTAIEPLMNHQPPEGGVCAHVAQDPEAQGLDAEQARHVAGLLAKGRESDAAMWESFYAADNAKARAAEASVREEQARAAAREAELRAAMPTARAARDWVMRECGFKKIASNRELEAVLDAVLADDYAAGTEYWVTAKAMAEAMREWRANGKRLRVPYGPAKFFGLGIWRDQRGWPWDQDALRAERRQQEARVGS